MREDAEQAAGCWIALFRGDQSDEAEAAAMRLDAIFDLVEAFILAHRQKPGAR